MKTLLGFWLCLAAAVGACGEDASSSKAYVWQLPPGFPEPKVPEDNPMSEAKVALGRRLFYEQRLSGSQTQACVSCHEQRLAFSDGKAVSMGSTGEHTPRGSMPLVNVAYNTTQTWANPALITLEQQIPIPLFGERPIELGATGKETEILARLGIDPLYPPMFKAAFADEANSLTMANVTKALASFVRTLISGNSTFDRNTFQNDKPP